MTTEHQQIESLINQLPLRSPSNALDQKMAGIFEQGRHEVEHENEIQRYSTRLWPAFVSTALVASFAGFVLGHYFKFENSGSQSRVAAAGVSGESGGTTQPKLTPVSFNMAAFDLMHGHSAQEKTDACKVCHIGENNETSEWFHGWYYGDNEFFKKHGKGDWSRCSTCHLVSQPKTPPNKFHEKPDRKGEHFHDGKVNCTDCHLVSNGQTHDSKAIRRERRS